MSAIILKENYFNFYLFLYLSFLSSFAIICIGFAGHFAAWISKPL